MESAAVQYKFLLFAKPLGFDMNQLGELVQKIKESFCLTLVHFYPLAGRLATLKKEESIDLAIYIACNKGFRARFIHASLDLAIDDILSPTYAPGNATSTKADYGELLEQSLGWAVWLLHHAVINQTRVSHEQIESWLQSGELLRASDPPDAYSKLLGCSLRFNMYVTEFGLGKPVAVLNGSTNKFDGKLIVNPGAEEGGSMDFGICLLLHVMTSLVSDKELMRQSLSL
ncbi:uncharacterized acetyltransferase At3g50280-like [Coffea arabica]|uniref:Uncharacterized acetyltransferase At3g50280-like n=1 Tax=Coffea arabica TaxID=13443 RepID=A0A6P6W4B0_COFAR|nr:uncharacterized protein LOC113728814 [Coffea arabica]